MRFAWWGAEEASLVGSTFYVANLADEEAEAIELYLNFDMIGSPNYGLFVLDGDGDAFGTAGPAGSDDIEALFERYYEERGEISAPKAFDGRSDYAAFTAAGIPAGGLFTGAEVLKTAEQVGWWGGTAGVAFDPCYHAACDTIDNLDDHALALNADAVAYAVYLYASGREVIGRTDGPVRTGHAPVRRHVRERVRSGVHDPTRPRGQDRVPGLRRPPDDG